MSRNSRRTRSRSAKSDPFTHRQARLQHLLLDELQSLITDEASDPALHGIKVLDVHLSIDGGHARVAYAVAALRSRQAEVGRESAEGLVRASGFLRARLAASLQLKRLPKLTFTFVGVDGGDA